MTYEIISRKISKKEIFVKNPHDVFEFIKRYAKSRQEQFLTITLDGSHKIIGIHIMSIGLANKTIAHPREIFYHAIKDNACALLLAHNHPSGQLIPSSEDNEITDRICEAGKIMGFHIIDHIIFNKKSFTSMKEHGHKFNN